MELHQLISNNGFSSPLDIFSKSLDNGKKARMMMDTLVIHVNNSNDDQEKKAAQAFLSAIQYNFGNLNNAKELL